MKSTTLVVTRPSGQASALTEALQTAIASIAASHPEQGWQAPQILALPLLTIVPKSDPNVAAAIRTAMQTADLAVFVSPNAIECTMRLLGDDWQSIAQRPIPIGVVGQSSYHALERHGIGREVNLPTPIWMPGNPAQWDSEGLWKEIQNRFPSWAGRRVVVFRGDGGREWLADQLQSVGAQVEAIAVYSRIPLSESSPQWEKVLNADTDSALWILTSSEAVRHLGAVLKQQCRQDYLASASALCPHHNIARSAHEIGFGVVLECHSGDAALVSAAITWLEAESKKPH
ncbi:uroporphyrinogen-III synthase [Polynucleobacter sp.]|jgi:uroporphyrinogen-III synthase|uniref:uroporphyrinogen-III synthase n=1 Tax=Polynucleobacter sp. TaxID=2029855 RepID=UPI0027342CC4|nr:uroporphyrinogen-III synthase [Polynucleobacter sp.]MDP3121196.1 uroporphyrinogen-III synthase [Polynucleobacter sp.]